MLNFLGTVGGGSDVVGTNDGNSCRKDDLQHGGRYGRETVYPLSGFVLICLHFLSRDSVFYDCRMAQNVNYSQPSSVTEDTAAKQEDEAVSNSCDLLFIHGVNMY
jgi:hypothetical protein